MTQQEAYQELRIKLHHIAMLRTEIFNLAAEHDLIVAAVNRDGELDTIDPSRLETKEVPSRHWDYNLKKYVEDGTHMERRFKADDPEYPGEYEDAWIPSQLC